MLPSDLGFSPIISRSSFITLHYRIGMASGKVLVSTFEDKPATFQMGSSQLSEGLEICLVGLGQGAHEVFDLPASQAYGEHNTDLIQQVSRRLLAEHGLLKAPGEASTQAEDFDMGDFVEFPAPYGSRYVGTVVGLQEEAIVFDFNHPLAGQALVFEVKIIGVL